MPNLLDDAVDAVYNENPSAFQDTIGSILQDKLRERIGVEKIAIAQSFMGDDSYENGEQEEVTDEDF
jgi:hypothetical protein